MSQKPSDIISVIHGPNLNLLGKRETTIYGAVTLSEINTRLSDIAELSQFTIHFFQSNHEGALIDFIQEASESLGFVINPAAYTHTSIALRDALLAVAKPFVEVHLSEPMKRESFRQHSYFSDIALAVVSGKGENSYYEGLTTLMTHLRQKP